MVVVVMVMVVLLLLLQSAGGNSGNEGNTDTGSAKTKQYTTFKGRVMGPLLALFVSGKM